MELMLVVKGHHCPSWTRKNPLPVRSNLAASDVSIARTTSSRQLRYRSRLNQVDAPVPISVRIISTPCQDCDFKLPTADWASFIQGALIMASWPHEQNPVCLPGPIRDPIMVGNIPVRSLFRDFYAKRKCSASSSLFASSSSSYKSRNFESCIHFVPDHASIPFPCGRPPQKVYSCTSGPNDRYQSEHQV